MQLWIFFNHQVMSADCCAFRRERDESPVSRPCYLIISAPRLSRPHLAKSVHIPVSPELSTFVHVSKHIAFTMVHVSDRITWEFGTCMIIGNLTFS